MERSSTGGICQARVISQAETPASASALPSDSTPSATASRRRDSPRAQQAQTAHSPHDQTIDDPVTDRDDALAMSDDHHRRTGPCPLDDGPQHAVLGVGVQVRGGLVEQQHRGARSERSGQAQPLPLAQRQPDAAAPEHGVHPVRQLGQHVIESCCRASAFNISPDRRAGAGCRGRYRGPARGVAAARTTVATTRRGPVRRRRLRRR